MERIPPRNEKTPGTEKNTEGSGNLSSPGLKKLQGESLEVFRQSVKKVELPMFNGDDPVAWITWAKIYFKVQETSPKSRVNLAQLNMEGPTIHFFNSLLESEEELTWEQLKVELLERYGGIGEGDVYEQLTSLRQRGSVDESILEFERLTAQVKRLPDAQYFGYFIQGLKEETWGRVRSLKVPGPLPRSRLQNLTKAVEKELQGKGGGLNVVNGSRGIGTRN